MLKDKTFFHRESPNVKKVLFLCSGNSCRSQMAEGLLRHLAGDKFEVFSAGIYPSEVHPLAIKVMDEVGIDIAKQRSKSVNQFLNQQFDYLITVCDKARQTCPAFPGNYEKIDWDLEDPVQAEGREGERLILFRKVRDQIKENIIRFLDLPKDKANLKCPACGKIQEIAIPSNSCLHFYECIACHKVITPTSGSCCVICSYSDKNCPK